MYIPTVLTQPPTRETETQLARALRKVKGPAADVSEANTPPDNDQKQHR